VAVTGLALMVAGALITAWSSTFLVASVGRTLSGAGFVVANTVFAKMIADWFAGKELATAMAVMLTAWPVGIGLALVSLASVASTFSWRTAVESGGAVALLGLVLVLALYRRPTGAGPAPAVAVAAVDAREVRLSVVGGIAWGALNGSLLVFVAFAPGVLAANGASIAQAGAIVSVTLWVTIVSIPLGGQLVDRLGHADYIVVFGSVATALCIGALPGFGAPAFWCVMVALAIAPSPGAIMALLPRTVRPETLGTAFGIFYSVYYAVVALAQPMAGFVRDRVGDAASPIVFIAMRATKAPERAPG
jgi:MFS family permease